MEPIENLAREWLRLDQDEATTTVIRHLLEENNGVELEKRLRTRLTFGTAGLRARMGAGFSRINALTVIQASQGLAAYLLRVDKDTSVKGVVIGHDARHNSERYAKLTAAAFVTKGIKVWWYEDLVHTPMVPFGVTELRAAAGVMITASHNPAQDNGYKVYWSNGCQITPPHDKEIAASIRDNLEPLSWDPSLVDQDNLLVEGSLDFVKAAYFNSIRRLPGEIRGEAHPEKLAFVYTPMHGVGETFMREACLQEGFSGMNVVKEQAVPNPDFPTVKLPNPEERGALDLAIACANEHKIDLIIANDPDADRLAAAERVNGKWHQFTGDQVGVLLAAYVMEENSRLSGSSRLKLAILSTAVSTAMVRKMAECEGFHHQETLTGFKWLGSLALQLREDGYQVAYGFEEALGYMFTEVAYDKDAVAAGIVFLKAILYWRLKGLTPWQKLQQLYKRYGYFENANSYFTSLDPIVTNRVFDNIRSLGHPHLTSLGSWRVKGWRDMTTGYDSTTSDHRPRLPIVEGNQMITCDLDNGVHFTVRGSGTEPKIKVYIEGQGENKLDASSRAEAVLRLLDEEWFSPYGLQRA